jgi:hypothetical protein
MGKFIRGKIIRRSKLLRTRKEGNETLWCEVNVELREIEKGLELSICGSTGVVVKNRMRGEEVHTRRDGNDYVIHSCGQIRKEIASFFPEVAPHLKFHLNGMNAACEHQEAAGWRVRTYTESEAAKNEARRAMVILPEMYRSLRVHPYGSPYAFTTPDGVFVPPDVLSQPCWVCGYKYGTEWLYRPLPEEVVQWAKTFGEED